MTDTDLRVLVALDPGAPSADAFAAIGAFTSGFAHVEVTGVFVADDNLLRLASLPVVREVAFAGQYVAETRSVDLRQQVEVRAERVKATFEIGMRALHAQHRFVVCQGDVVAELRRQASTADLLVIAQSQRPGALRTWLGVAIKEMLIAPPTDLLFVQEPWATGRSILLVKDRAFASASANASADAQRAERIAEHLATAQRLPLATLTTEDDAGGYGIASVLNACRACQPRLVILLSHADHHPFDANDLLRHIGASVLLLRASP